MDLHKSTAHRSLMVLERSALIERTQENRFRLGLKLYELGNRAVEQIDSARARASVLPPPVDAGGRDGAPERAAEDVGRLSGQGRTESRVCMSSKIGTSNPVYCTSMGKAMLAFQPAETIEQIVAKIRFVRHTPKTICTREALLKALEKSSPSRVCDRRRRD